MRKNCLPFLFLFLLASCGKPDDKPAVLFKDQRQSLDRAKGVDATMNQQAQEQREKIEEATQK